MLETCLSIVRSNDSVTPSTLTSLLWTMVSSPSCRPNLGPRLPRVRQQRLDLAQRSLVLSAFNFSLLADIQWPTSVRHRSSCRAVNGMSSRLQCRYSCVLLANAWYSPINEFWSCAFTFTLDDSLQPSFPQNVGPKYTYTSDVAFCQITFGPCLSNYRQ